MWLKTAFADEIASTMGKRRDNKGKRTRTTQQRTLLSNNGGSTQAIQHAHQAAIQGNRYSPAAREELLESRANRYSSPASPIAVASIAAALAASQGPDQPSYFEVPFSEVFPPGSLEEPIRRALAVRNTKKFKEAQKKAKEEKKRSTASTSEPSTTRRSPRFTSTNNTNATEGQTAEEPQRDRQ